MAGELGWSEESTAEELRLHAERRADGLAWALLPPEDSIRPRAFHPSFVGHLPRDPEQSAAAPGRGFAFRLAFPHRVGMNENASIDPNLDDKVARSLSDFDKPVI